jgi:hypothetical protein
MLKSDLQGWFESHPAISPRQFAIEAGWPNGGHFQRWIKKPAEQGEVVSAKIFGKIKPVLKKYGYAELQER